MHYVLTTMTVSDNISKESLCNLEKPNYHYEWLLQHASSSTEKGLKLMNTECI